MQQHFIVYKHNNITIKMYSFQDKFFPLQLVIFRFYRSSRNMMR